MTLGLDSRVVVHKPGRKVHTHHSTLRGTSVSSPVGAHHDLTRYYRITVGNDCGRRTT